MSQPNLNRRWIYETPFTVLHTSDAVGADSTKGYPIPEPLMWSLRSRGWIDAAGMLTEAGKKYIAQTSILDV